MQTVWGVRNVNNNNNSLFSAEISKKTSLSAIQAKDASNTSKNIT